MGNTSGQNITPNNIWPGVVTNPGSLYKWDNSVTQLVIGTLLSDVTELGYLGGVIPSSLINTLGVVFPEFRFYTQSNDMLYTQRLTYFGDISNCCLTNINHYLINNLNWITCDPLSKKPATSNYCDNIFRTYCVSNPIDTSICGIWFGGLNARYANNDLTALVLIQTVFDSVSQSNISNVFYEEVMNLYHKWGINNELFDERLTQLANNNRSKYLCSFPLQDILNMAREYTTPRICWDPNCSDVSPGRLLTKDLVARNNCTVTLCNVEMNNYVTSYKTYLDSSCSSKVKNRVSLPNVLRSFNKSTLSIPYIPYLTLTAISFGLIANSLHNSD